MLLLKEKRKGKNAQSTVFISISNDRDSHGVWWQSGKSADPGVRKPEFGHCPLGLGFLFCKMRKKAPGVWSHAKPLPQRFCRLGDPLGLDLTGAAFGSGKTNEGVKTPKN